MVIGASVEKVEKLAQKKKTEKIIPYTKVKDKNVRINRDRPKDCVNLQVGVE